VWLGADAVSCQASSPAIGLRSAVHETSATANQTHRAQPSNEGRPLKGEFSMRIHTDPKPPGIGAISVIVD
jgi:hypothetical protein